VRLTGTPHQALGHRRLTRGQRSEAHGLENKARASLEAGGDPDGQKQYGGIGMRMERHETGQAEKDEVAGGRVRCVRDSLGTRELRAGGRYRPARGAPSGRGARGPVCQLGFVLAGQQVSWTDLAHSRARRDGKNP